MSPTHVILATMETLLLQTKLHIPPTRARLVSRAHLITQLNEGLDRKLTLISAPAGFGKTTLLSAWAIEAKRPVTWLGLDEADNDTTRFFAYLIATLQSIDDRIGRAVDALLQAPHIPAAKSLMTTLVNDIAAIAPPFALVLDDFHFLVSNSRYGIEFQKIELVKER